MENKQDILAMLNVEFNRWENLLGKMSEPQLTTRQLPSGWSIKDVMAHLMTWQKRSTARMEAGLLNHNPEFPAWLDGIDPNEEEPVDQINAWIFETNRDRPWQDVYRDWRNGYLTLMELSEQIPEDVLMESGRFSWLGDYPLSAVLVGSLEHHDEHIDELLGWLHLDDGQK
jgi:hypothetical protein